MKCLKCGTDNPSNATYCSGCGNLLEQQTDINLVKKKKSGKKTWLIATGLIIVITIAIVGGSALKKKIVQHLNTSADISLQETDYEKAEKNYQKVLKINPSGKSAYAGIMQAYYYQGKNDEMEEVLAEAENKFSEAGEFKEIRYWDNTQKRIQTYLEFIGETELRLPGGGIKTEERKVQTFGLSFLKNVDLDGDGIDEIILAYTDTTPDEQAGVIEYTMEVWAYQDGTMTQIHTGEVAKMNGDRAVILEYMDDGTVQFVSNKTADGLFTTYYGLKEGKIIPELDVEMKLSSGLFLVNGQEASAQQFNDALEKYRTTNSKTYMLQGYVQKSGTGVYELEKSKLELQYQLQASEESFKYAIEKAQKGQIDREQGEQVQDGNYISVSEESGMYLNVYTDDQKNKVLEIRYYYDVNGVTNVESVRSIYDKETGTYQEVSEEPSHILSISQSGEQVSILIKDKNTGYGMDAHLLLESQYDSVESHKEYRKKYVARTLLTEEEATRRENQEAMSESFEIELSKEEVIDKVQTYYNDLLSEEDGGEYNISESEVSETENGYSMILRYAMSEERTEETMANGGTPQANTLVGIVSVDMETGQVSMEDGETWYLIED